MNRATLRRSWLNFSLLSLTLVFAAGCQQIGSGEHAVVFSALPRFLGGGLERSVLQPGQIRFLLPWETLYRVDTSIQSIAWGGVGQGDNRYVEDYVQTRTLDGNEVGLAMTLQYHVNPQTLPHVVAKVGAEKELIHQLVTFVARADIRTHMNALRTRDFFGPKERQTAVENVKQALIRRLGPEGIVIDNVIYNDHRFERRKGTGAPDRRYQEQIDRTQAIEQQKQQEEKRVATVVEQKKQEYNVTQAKVNRVLETAEGFKRQAVVQGDAMLAAKRNEADQVKNVGMSEVEALKKEIAALSGPGGRAILRLTLIREMIKQNPRFVVVNSAPGGIDFNRLDSNELIKQMGIATAGSEGVKPAPAPTITVEQPSARK